MIVAIACIGCLVLFMVCRKKKNNGAAASGTESGQPKAPHAPVDSNASTGSTAGNEGMA